LHPPGIFPRVQINLSTVSASVTTPIISAAIITWPVSTIAVSIAIIRSRVGINRCHIRNNRGRVNARSIIIARGGVDTHPNARTSITISASINDSRRGHRRKRRQN
jgi:hypothetical protein